jgi:hypothetical protein
MVPSAFPSRRRTSAAWRRLEAGRSPARMDGSGGVPAAAGPAAGRKSRTGGNVPPAPVGVKCRNGLRDGARRPPSPRRVRTQTQVTLRRRPLLSVDTGSVDGKLQLLRAATGTDGGEPRQERREFLPLVGSSGGRLRAGVAEPGTAGLASNVVIRVSLLAAGTSRFVHFVPPICCCPSVRERTLMGDWMCRGRGARCPGTSVASQAFLSTDRRRDWPRRPDSPRRVRNRTFWRRSTPMTCRAGPEPTAGGSS